MHFDARETRSREEREAELLRDLPGQVAHAKAATPFYAELLAGVDPGTITTRAALAALPLTRKSQLVERQRAARPFGGLNATPASRLARIFMSPGPIYDPEGRGPDFWRTARALFAAGFRPAMSRSIASRTTSRRRRACSRRDCTTWAAR
jgi:phenylacetate-CoA ligase